MFFEDDRGVGAPIDLAEARHRLALAAEQGDAYAQTKLGMMHWILSTSRMRRRSGPRSRQTQMR